METLRPHWHEITLEEFREPDKKYMLNRVLSIEDAGNATSTIWSSKANITSWSTAESSITALMSWTR